MYIERELKRERTVKGNNLKTQKSCIIEYAIFFFFWCFGRSGEGVSWGVEEGVHQNLININHAENVPIGSKNFAFCSLFGSPVC